VFGPWGGGGVGVGVQAGVTFASKVTPKLT
jgi:hypothetical protein